MILGLVALVVGCGGDEPADAVPVYPPPPERARFILEYRLRDRADIVAPERNRLMALAVGDEAVTLMEKPLDVAARHGRVYVTDTARNLVHVFDAPRRKWFALGYRREGELREPLAVAADGAGRIYVVDRVRNAVVVYDALGLYQGVIGHRMFDRPVGVGVTGDGSRVYVVDNGGVDGTRHGIVAFDAAGTVVWDKRERGFGRGTFQLPTAVDVAADGTVYVLDAGNFQVQKLNPDGSFVSSWGRPGNRPGMFARPRGLAVGRGLVHVSDSAFGTVQVFDLDGRLLMDIGRFGTGARLGEFPMMSGLAVDETGRLYVVDQVLRAVTVFAPVP